MYFLIESCSVKTATKRQIWISTSNVKVFEEILNFVSYGDMLAVSLSEFKNHLKRCLDWIEENVYALTFWQKQLKVGVCENAVVQRDQRFWHLVICSSQWMDFDKGVLFWFDYCFYLYVNSLYIIVNSNFIANLFCKVNQVSCHISLDDGSCLLIKFRRRD